MSDLSLTRRSATELAQLIRTRAVSAAEVLEAHLEKIDRLNADINAVVTLAPEQARRMAVSADDDIARGDTLGPLHGLPVLIKDITETAGIRTTYGSRLYKDHVPAEDAEVVARLRRAGAIVVGKTNTPEFAAGASTVNSLFGATRNPWNLALSPAGSSGGSAAAVAAGMVPLAQGTDFGCSVRIPAAFCGIVGLRPTAGLTPNRPMRMPWDAGQVHGPMARTAEDAALMLDAMIGVDPFWPLSTNPPWTSALEEMRKTPDLAGRRIAYVSDMAGIGVDPEIDRVCWESVQGLQDAGATVDKLDFEMSAGVDAYKILRGEWMVGQQWERLDQLQALDFNLADNVRQGLRLTVRATAAAEDVREKVWKQFCDVLRRYDLVTAPAAPVPPFPIDLGYPREIAGRKLETYVDWIASAFVVTLIGFPAASAPVALTTTGLPVGLQIIGRRFSEPQILAAAKIAQTMNPIGWPGVS